MGLTDLIVNDVLLNILSNQDTIKRIYQNFKNKMSLKEIDSKIKDKSNVKVKMIKVIVISDIKQILFGTPLDRFMNFEESTLY